MLIPSQINHMFRLPIAVEGTSDDVEDDKLLIVTGK